LFILRAKFFCSENFYVVPLVSNSFNHTVDTINVWYATIGIGMEREKNMHNVFKGFGNGGIIVDNDLGSSFYDAYLNAKKQFAVTTSVSASTASSSSQENALLKISDQPIIITNVLPQDKTNMFYGMGILTGAFGACFICLIAMFHIWGLVVATYYCCYAMQGKRAPPL